MKDEKGRDFKFIIIIPIVILILSFCFDTALIFIEERYVEGVTKSIAKEVLATNVTNYREIIKDKYESKKINTDLLEANFEEGYLYIRNSHTYPSFFGKLVGTNSYRVETHIKAHLNGDEVIIEEESLDE